MQYARNVIERKTKSRWYLRASDLYEGQTPTIEWSNVLEPGKGTKHQRSYLITSFKELIDAMIDVPRITKGSLSHGTVLNWVFIIQRMIRWMVNRGVWRFSALTLNDIQEYIEWCKVHEASGANVLETTYVKKIAVLHEMWELRKLYIGGLRVNPTLIIPVEPCRKRSTSSWKALDEVAALNLIGDAIKFLKAHSNYLLEVAGQFWSLERTVGLTKNQRRKKRAELYVQLATEPEFQRIRSDLSVGEKRKPYLILWEAMLITEGACVVLILFLVGMRIRELTRLDSGCLELQPTNSGEMLSRIRGVAAKQNGKSRSWVTNEAVNEAINYLDKFYCEPRKAAGLKALIVNRRTGGGFPSVIFKLVRSQPSTVADKMARFAKSSYRNGSPPIGRLHPHRARKTFARFVVLRDKSALESLSYHYGHVHREITDRNYVGADIELSNLIAEESRKDLAQGLTDLLSSSNVAGKAGQSLMELKRAPSAKLRGKLGLKKKVNELIEKGVQLAPCDWGYCVYSQAYSACHGDADGPNPLHRSADVCSTCTNFAATERHRLWWEERYRADESFLRQDHLPAQTVMWVKRRIENTSEIVRGLNRARLLSESQNDSSEYE